MQFACSEKHLHSQRYDVAAFAKENGVIFPETN